MLSGQDPSLYNCGPQCPLTLYLYLIRLEPFTSLHKELQSGKFDIPERIFSSILSLFTSISLDLNDYRELIPEFFFQPEFLINLNSLNFGLNQKDFPNNNVILPSWAENPFDFIYLHRKALESDFVSNNIHNWFDLIWGYKQNGEESKKSFNTFSSELYESIWNNNDINKNQIELLKEQLGQIPLQIFFKPHSIKKSIKKFEINFYEYQLNSSFFNHSILIDQKIEILDQEFNKYSFNYFDLIENSLNSIKYSISFDLNEFLLISKNKILILEKNNSKIYDLNIEKILIYLPKLITYFISNSYFLFIGEDYLLKLFNSKFIEINTFPIFLNNINLSFISEIFHIILISSINGLFLIISLENFNLINSFQIEKNYIPLKILITNSFGFIIIYCLNNFNKYILIYNINGLFIKKILINFNLKNKINFNNNKSFDYLIFSTENGDIYLTEAYYFNFNQLILKTNSKILNLYYFEQNNICIIINNNNKKIYCIPIKTN